MSTSPITSSSAASAQNLANLNTSLGATGNSALGEQDFMKLMTAQLANQDPMQPESNTDFIAQMATFSSLQQMQSLNQTFSISNADGYLGKTVTVTDPASGKAVTGSVTQVYANNGDPQLTINGSNYDISTVQSVSTAASSSTTSSTIPSSTN